MSEASEFFEDDEEEEEDEEKISHVQGAQVPEGGIVNAHISIAQYVDPETGGMKYSITYGGDCPMTQYLGLLQIGIFQIYNDSTRWQGEDDEEES